MRSYCEAELGLEAADSRVEISRRSSLRRESLLRQSNAAGSGRPANATINSWGTRLIQRALWLSKTGVSMMIEQPASCGRKTDSRG